jgi:drug/metabolite transporter (DMT)-like permease
MTSLTHDTTPTAAPSRLGAGLGFALVSATTFGLSGALARGLLDSGWSAPAAVTARIVIAALVLVVPGALALRGRWHLLSRNGGLVAAYGVAAVAGAQLCYFYAVSYLQVGVALLIEYTAPVAVVVWLWLRHGHRPHRLTVVGAAIAAVGLVLVLDVVSGADLNLVGVAWGLGAMVGAATYFVISADEDNGLPGISLAAGGLVVGGTVLGVAGLLGVLPMRVSSERVSYQGSDVDWWVPVLALGLVTAAIAYVTGIEAGRRLGSRLASFVALTEVLMALVFAWLLLGELPRPIQLAGGLLVLAGVVVVKLGEGSSSPVVEPVPDPVSERPAA